MINDENVVGGKNGCSYCQIFSHSQILHCIHHRVAKTDWSDQCLEVAPRHTRTVTTGECEPCWVRGHIVR